ncbi:MAG TPA: extracellular solute-binding protein [Brevefilum sp.]|nr:extracellular solute-binding protein [Brevefilum sp.]HOR19487.1 extracellular solute-binding protein [Brevefilum sp.]HPL69183.1 extracellular solute-binding protein [Brevefilum sp.]
MQRKILFSGMRGMFILLLALLAIASCAPEVVPEVAEPAFTATQFRTSTRTATAEPPAAAVTATQSFATVGVDPKDLQGTLIRFAHPWVGRPADTLEGIAGEFSRSNPWGIKVEVDPHSGETALVESIMQMEVGDDLPDVIAAPVYLRSSLGEDVSLVDLGFYFNNPEWGFSLAEREDILMLFLEPFEIDGQIIAMPFIPQATVLFFNRSWALDLGFSGAPRDLDAFTRQNCEATFANWQDDDKVGGTGGWAINLDPRVLAGWYYAFGGVLPEDEIPLFNNQAGKESFGYLWDIKSQGCIWFALEPDHQAYFAKRLALMYAGQLDQIAVQTGWMNTASNEDEWEVIGFPGPEGELILVESPGLMITASTPEEELATWLFIKHLLEPEIQTQLVESLFTLPVRRSAMESLTDFAEEYPQWAQGVALMESARALPASKEWGIAQWLLQDAANRILQDESGNVTLYLEQLDEKIIEFVDTPR